MADGGKASIYYSQVNEVVKDVFNYLMIEKPVTTKQQKGVTALHKSLNETGCLKKGTEISKRKPLDDLQAIGKGIVVKPYTVGILITWLNLFLPSYVKKLKSNSDVKGVKVLLKSMAETNKRDAETVKGWLSTHSTQRSPAVEFDNVKKSTSLLEAVYKNAKHECVPEIKQIENSSKLKDKLKQYMTDPLCELKYNDILAGCGMQNISEVWKQFVENDEVFNQYSAVCVPYLARMLEVNITVFAYPSKECVSFNYDDSGDDVTITLCFYDDKFVQLVPSSEFMKDHRTLREKIVHLKERIKELEQKLKETSGKSERETEKLQQELAETKEKLEQCKLKLKEEIDSREQKMKIFSKELTEKLLQEWRDDTEKGSDSYDLTTML